MTTVHTIESWKDAFSKLFSSCGAMLTTSIFVYLLFPLEKVFAACDSTTEFCNPLKYENIQQLLMAIVETAIYILTPIIILMVIYTGFLFVQAQGKPDKLTTARTSLMWTLIGAVIVLGAKGISLAIKATVDSVL